MKYSKPFFAVAKTLFPRRFSPISHLDSFGFICSTILLTCFPAVLSSDLGSKTKHFHSVILSLSHIISLFFDHAISLENVQQMKA